MPISPRSKSRNGSVSPHFIRRLSSRLALSASLFAGAGLANSVLNPQLQAANFILNGNDPVGTSSFTNPLTGAAPGWSLTGAGAATAPTTGNTYEDAATSVNNFLLRTPTDTNSYDFAGDLLQLDAQSRFLIKANGTITFNNLGLILNGGLLDLGNTFGTTATVAGSGGITLTTGTTSTILAESGFTLTISTVIGTGGTGNINFGGSAATAGLGSTTGIAGTGTVILTAAETYTGTTNLSAGTLTLSGTNGALTGTSSIALFGGTLNLDNTASFNADRIKNSAPIALNGGAFVLKGNSGLAETVGPMSGLGGGTVTVAFTSTSTSLTTTSFTHALGNGAILINGAGLGRDSITTAGRFFATTLPTLVGTTAATTTGNAGAGAPTNTKIVPFLVGEATATTGVANVGTATGIANTFVTYNASTGFRPLNPIDEFVQNAITTGANTRIALATTVAASSTINSLLIAGGNLTITDGQTLTDTSGAILFASSNSIAPSTSTGALGFGSTEALITAASGMTGTITAPITGSGGVTFTGPGTLNIGTGAPLLATVSGGISKAGGGTTTIKTTGANYLPSLPNAINIEGGVLAFADTVNTALTNPLGTGTITITPGGTLSINGGGGANTMANAIVISSANSAGVAILADVSGINTYSGGLSFAVGVYVPTVQLQNTNGTTALLSFTGGFTGIGNIQLNGTGAGSPITLSGTAVNNAGSITNIGSNVGTANASTATISAAIGSNVTSITEAGVSAFTITGGITLGGDRAYSSSNTGAFTLGAITGTATAGNLQTITFAGSSTGQITDSGIIGDGAGGGKVAVVVNNTGTGNGLLALGGASTYSGGATLNPGSVTVAQINSSGSGASTVSGAFGKGLLTLAGGSLRATTTAATTVGNTSSVTADTTFVSGGANLDQNLTLSGPISLSGTRTFTVNTSPVAGATGVFFTGNVTGVGSSDGLTKAGPGELLLSGADTYGGVTTINAGVLAFQKPAALPNYTSQTPGLVSVATGAIASFGVGAVGSFSATDIDNLASGTIPITFAAGSFLGLDTTSAVGGTATVSNNFAVLPPNAGLAKTGNGILVLTGTNTYSTSTLIAQGILNAAEGAGLSSNSNLVINGANSANPATFAPTVAAFERSLGAGAGQMQITGGASGFTNLTAAPQAVDFGTGGAPVTLTWGGASFNPATLILNDTGATNTLSFVNAIDLNGALRSVGVNVSTAATSAALIGALSSTGASGGINKVGAGILNITNPGNTYAGLSQSGAGVLSFNGTGALPTGSQISLNGGTFQVLNDATGTFTYGNTVGILASSTFSVGNNGGGTTGSTLGFGVLLAPTTAVALATTTTFTSSNNYSVSFTSLALPGSTGSTTTLIANSNVIIGSGGVTNRGAGSTTNFDTLALQGTSLGSTINGVIADKAGGSITAGNYTPVTKTGTGTWTFTAANTYTGNTTISAGSLVLKDLTGTPTGTQVIGASQVLVNAPAGTLGISGNVSIGNGTATLTITQGTVVAGGATGTNGNISLLDGGINTLTINGNAFAGVTNFLTLGTTVAGQASTLSFDLSNSATDQIVVTPSGIAGSGKVNVQLGGATINLNQLAGSSIALGSYNLLTYAGETLTGAFTLGTSSAPVGEVFSLTNTGTNEILNVTSGAGATNVFYNGNINGNLTQGAGTTATNFVSAYTGGAPVALPDASTNVFFTASAAANFTTTLSQGLSVNSLSFTGAGTPAATNVVTIGAAASTNAITISAAAGFTDQNAVNYAAGVGIVTQAGTAANIINAPLVLAASQSFEIDSANPLTINGAISGAFTLTKTGTGTLILGGADTFSGGLAISNGTVVANVSNATTVSGAAGPSANAITLGSAGPDGGSATLLANTFTVSNPINLTPGAVGTLSLGNNGAATTATFSGNITGANDLTFVGAGTTILSGANTAFSGALNISNGIVQTGGVASNSLTALGTGQLNLSGGSLKVKSNGIAGQQLIITGNGITGNNIVVTGSTTLDVNNNGANANSAFVFNNLTIGAQTLNVTGANGYVPIIAGTTAISGAATLNPTTAPLDLLGPVNAGANNFAVTGTGATRLLNTSAGAPNALTGAVSVTGGVLQGFASAAGDTTPGSNSLGTATIALGGTTPVLRLTPSLAGGLSAATTAGLQEKGFTGVSSLGGTNFLGATQAVSTGSPSTGIGSPGYYNTPAGGQQVTGINSGATVATFPLTTSFQFNGLLNITTAGMYNFSTTTDDGGNLFIDGNAPIVTSVTTVAGSFYLSAGLHVFSERINNNAGSGQVTVSYQGADTGNALVIANNVFSTASAAQLATSFGNNITIAGATSGTIDIAANTSVGTVGFLGAGATSNVTGSGDVNTLTTGAVTTNGVSTLAPSTAVLVVPGVTGSAGGTDTLVLGGSSASSALYSAGNQVTGVIADGAGGTLAVTRSGTGAWTLSGAASNAYSGLTTVIGASNILGLTLAKTGGAIAVPGNLTIGDGTTGSATLILGGDNQIASTSTVTFTGVNTKFAYFQTQGHVQTIGNVVETTAGFGVIENRETAGTFGNSAITFNVASGVQAYQGYFRDISTGVVDATNSLALIKTGAGTLQFGLGGAAATGSASAAGIGAHGYSGGTTISNGSLQVTTLLAFPITGAGNVTLDGGAAVAGVLDLNSFSTGITGLNGVTGAVLGSVVNNSTGTATLTVGNNNNNGSFAGVLANNNNAGAGVLALTKVGAGGQTLSGLNTYTGATTISAGTLALGSGGNLGATAVSVNGGTFAAVPGVTSATTALGSSLTMAVGTAFTMADGMTSTANVTGAATLAAASGATTSLTFDINGASNGVSDVLAIGGAGTVGAAKATIFLNGIGASAATGNTYTFITAGSGLTPANFTFGNTNSRVVFGNTAFLATLGGTATTEFVNLGAGGAAFAYFTGNANPTILNATSGGGTVTNFSTDITGATDLGTQPNGATDVFFTAQTVTTPVTINTLGQNSSFDSLNFTSGAPAVTINESGAFSLTLGAGINDASGSAAQTVNVPLILNGAQTFTNNSANPLTIGGTITNGGFTLATAGTGNISFGGANSGGGGLTKTGTGTTTLVVAQSYSGTTTIGTGTLAATADQTLAGGLTFGAVANAATNATLDLSTANATFAGPLLVQTNSATANTITVGAGKTLTVNGSVTIGPVPVAANQVSKLTLGGGGAFTVATGAGGVFRIGGNNSGTLAISEAATLDLTGLSAVAINVSNTGTFAVSNSTAINTAGNQATLLLPTPAVATGIPVTTVTAQNFNVGDGSGLGSGAGQINTAVLGTGLTTLNANTVNVGTGGRDLGALTFVAGNGTIKLRAADGSSRAAINIATGGATTGVAPGTGTTGSLIDLTGHSADLLISTLTVGNQPRNTVLTADFKFDTGSLDATGFVIGADTTSANATNSPVITSTVTIGGGLTTIGTGGVQLGNVTNTSTGARTNAGSFNITGGTVNIGTTGVFSVRLGNNTAASGLAAANDTLSITGGTATLAGDIISANTTRTTSTLTLDGGTLDLSNHKIGGATALTNLNFRSGTLKNVLEINNGATGLTKTTGGSLTLAGTNNYTGGTAIKAGAVIVSGSLSGTSAVIVGDSANLSTSAVLTGSGSVGAVTVGAAAGNTGAAVDPGNGAASVSAGLVTGNGLTGVLTTGAFSLTASAHLAIQLGGTTAGAGYDQVNATGLTLAGDLQGSLINSFAPPISSMYFIAVQSGAAAPGSFGAFSNAPEGSTVTLSGQQFQITYAANWTGADAGSSFTGGNDVALLAIPEPNSLGMLIASLGMALGLQRFRRRPR